MAQHKIFSLPFGCVLWKFSLFIFVHFPFSQRFSRVFSPSNPAHTHTPTDERFPCCWMRETCAGWVKICLWRAFLGEWHRELSFFGEKMRKIRREKSGGGKRFHRKFSVTNVESLWHSKEFLFVAYLVRKLFHNFLPNFEERWNAYTFM